MNILHYEASFFCEVLLIAFTIYLGPFNKFESIYTNVVKRRNVNLVSTGTMAGCSSTTPVYNQL